MANDVFANGREISCKKADGKSICAFPDVCFTPPQTPATPPGVPIPYPNTAFAKDTTKGSKSVKVSGKEVMLKNKSYFKKSTGNEAGRAPKKGIVTSKITGKVYFTSWSPNVKFEGKNVVRHFDLTTHNHGSQAGQTPPWPYADSMDIDKEPCVGEKNRESIACQEFTPYGDKDPCPPDIPVNDYRSKKHEGKVREYANEVISGERDGGDCLRVRRCMLQPYKETEKGGCCNSQTGHHLIEDASFSEKFDQYGNGKYDKNKAPCVCVEGVTHSVGTHGIMHTFQSTENLKCANGKTTISEAQKNGTTALCDTFPESGCSKECIEAQLSQYYQKDCGMDDSTEIKAVTIIKSDATVKKRLKDAANYMKTKTSGAG